MTSEKLYEVVRKLEPFFMGYKAHDNMLKNENGMTLVFRISWNNKTTVSGLYAKHNHTIGCSLEKSPEMIFKDIRKRLMPEYHKDFFETKRETIERQEAEEEDLLKLKALASVVGGELSHHYGYRGVAGNEYVSAESVSIYPSYSGHYKFEIELNYIDAMRLAHILKNSSL